MKKIFFLLLVLTVLPAGAITTEDELDREIFGGGSLKPPKEKTIRWNVSGFLQSTFQAGVPFTSDSSDYKIAKIEGRGRLDARYSYKSFFVKATLDAYYYPEQHFRSISPRNRLDASELYFQFGEKLQVKAGIQRFSWGNAEVFGVTGFLTQLDLSEALAKETADIKRGIGALSVKYIMGNLGVETVWVPLRYSVITPDGFWELKERKQYETEFINTDPVDYSIKKSSAALRMGGSFAGMDVFFSYFNGYYSSVLINSSMIETGSLIAGTIDYSQVKKESRLEQERVNCVGIEISTVLKKITLRFESSIVPDMAAVEKIGDAEIDQVILDMSDGSSDGKLSEVRRVPYLAYTLGGDLNLWGSNGMLLFEWNQGIYLKDTGSYSVPALSYLLVVYLQDTFCDGRLMLRGGTLLRPVRFFPGGLFNAEVLWKFTTNLSLVFKGMVFMGNGDELFEYLQDKDFFELKIRYHF